MNLFRSNLTMQLGEMKANSARHKSSRLSCPQALSISLSLILGLSFVVYFGVLLEHVFNRRDAHYVSFEEHLTRRDVANKTIDLKLEDSFNLYIRAFYGDNIYEKNLLSSKMPKIRVSAFTLPRKSVQ